jgi:hypothetical protein
MIKEYYDVLRSTNGSLKGSDYSGAISQFTQTITSPQKMISRDKTSYKCQDFNSVRGSEFNTK